MDEGRLVVSISIGCAVIAAAVALLTCFGVLVLCVQEAPEAFDVSAGASRPSQEGGEGSSDVLSELVGRVDATRKRAEAEKAAADELANRASALVSSGDVITDGVPLDFGNAEAIASHAGPFADNVTFIDQRGILPAGCEIVALSVALRAEGFDASPVEIAEHHLDMSGSSGRSYGGSPWVSGGGFPASIVDAGNSWLAAQPTGAPGARVVDLTGTAFSGVLELVSLGYPVLVWTTEDMAEPVFSGATQGGLEWYYPEHCVVVYGLEGSEVLVSDSLAGLVRRDRAAFERIYERCGNLAALVVPE